MDAAARRFERAGRCEALIASTDADTQAAPDWIAWTLEEARAADAVAGRIVLAADERGRLAAAARALYLRETAYRHVVAELEAARDPLPADPSPRHGQHFGASFALSVRAYRAAGGVPPLPALEDAALYEALLRVDARVRHSPRVRVTTSSRLEARAAGGFATFLSDLDALGRRGAPWLVDDPRATLARIDARAALRRIWRGSPRAGDAELASTAFGPAEHWRLLLDREQPFGLNHERIAAGAAQPVAALCAGAGQRGAGGAATAARRGERAAPDPQQRRVGCGLTQVHLQVAHEAGERQRLEQPARADRAHRQLDRFERGPLDEHPRHVGRADRARGALGAGIGIEGAPGLGTGAQQPQRRLEADPHLGHPHRLERVTVAPARAQVAGGRVEQGLQSADLHRAEAQRAAQEPRIALVVARLAQQRVPLQHHPREADLKAVRGLHPERPPTRRVGLRSHVFQRHHAHLGGAAGQAGGHDRAQDGAAGTRGPALGAGQRDPAAGVDDPHAVLVLGVPDPEQQAALGIGLRPRTLRRRAEAADQLQRVDVAFVDAPAGEVPPAGRAQRRQLGVPAGQRDAALVAARRREQHRIDGERHSTTVPGLTAARTVPYHALMDAARIVSLNLGTPREVEWEGRSFSTAIVKTPAAGRVELRGVNLVGDDQANRRVHGGHDKAVYAYAAESYAWWETELGTRLGPGTFGENLTTGGIDADGATIGERWRVGTAVLEVAEPRIPCFKLGWRMRDARFVKRFSQALRLGVYLRIVEPGSAAAGEPIELLARPAHGLSAREVARIFLFEHARAAELLAVPALADSWHEWAAGRVP